MGCPGTRGLRVMRSSRVGCHNTLQRHVTRAPSAVPARDYGRVQPECAFDDGSVGGISPCAPYGTSVTRLGGCSCTFCGACSGTSRASAERPGAVDLSRLRPMLRLGRREPCGIPSLVLFNV